jgi:hypothetical protein
MAVDLAHPGIHIHRQGPAAGPGTSRPCPAQDLLGGLVELADMTEGEGAQERPQRAGRHHLVAQHLGGGHRAQHVGVVDAVTAGHQRVHQGQDLASRPVRAGPLAQIDQLVDHRLDLQPLRQRRGQQQASVGDRVAVVERHDEPAWAVRRWHRERALLIGMMDVSATPFSLLRGPFS